MKCGVNMVDTLKSYLDDCESYFNERYNEFDPAGSFRPNSRGESVIQIIDALADSNDIHSVDVLEMTASKGGWCVRYESLRRLQEISAGNTDLALNARDALDRFEDTQLPHLTKLICATRKHLPHFDPAAGWRGNLASVLKDHIGATMLLSLFPAVVTVGSSEFAALKSGLRIIREDEDFIRSNVRSDYGLGVICSAAEVLIAAGHHELVAGEMKKWACSHWLRDGRPVELLSKCGACPSEADLEERRRENADDYDRRWEADRQRTMKLREEQTRQKRKRQDILRQNAISGSMCGHAWELKATGGRRYESFAFTCVRCSGSITRSRNNVGEFVRLEVARGNTFPDNFSVEGMLNYDAGNDFYR